MPIPTTYTEVSPIASAELIQLPSLREREYDAICDALADGALVALASADEIVGALTPEHADAYLALAEDKPARDRRAEKVAAELHSLSEELRTLRQIVREVMAEKRPQDFDHRIAACIDDAEGILKGATELAEEL
jgi:hypothetical protein